MPACGQTAFGQNRIWPKSVFQSVDRIWPNLIWPELVFLVFWPCVCVSRFWVCSRLCVCCVCCVCVVSSRFWWVSSRFLGVFKIFGASPRTPSPGPPPPLDGPSAGPPKISLFFFSLPPEISFFLLFLGGLLVEFARLGSRAVV